jgi:hypothetical protein
MATYKFDITLVSGLFDTDLDSTYGSDPHEAFDYYFFNHGATDVVYDASPCLKPGVSSPPKDASLVGLDWDAESELFEGSDPNFEIQSLSGDVSSGWNYTYHLLTTFSGQTSAESLDEAIVKVRNYALDNLAIYDGGLDEIIEVEDVRIVFKAND